MKKLLILLLCFLIISCKQNKQITTDPFLELLNEYPHDHSKINQYQNEYNLTNNIIYAINKVNYPNFLIPHQTKYSSFSKNNIILVNTNYYLVKDMIPANLVIPIDVDYIKKDIPIKLAKETYEAYKIMYDHAKQLNYNLTIFSGYRSYEYQENLYLNSSNGYVAKPGTSEHQSGYAIDISLRTTGLTTHFAHTDEAKFLLENAHLYGFILRYPKDKSHITGYPYESWHYRYVGISTATFIYENNLTLEEYFYYYVLL